MTTAAKTALDAFTREDGLPDPVGKTFRSGEIATKHHETIRQALRVWDAVLSEELEIKSASDQFENCARMANNNLLERLREIGSGG